MKNLEKILKNYGIDIKPATKKVAQMIKIVDYDGNLYYSAIVYEFRDIYLEEIGFLLAMTENDLKEQLKRIYNCNYIKERNLKNFIEWYQNLTGKKLSSSGIKKVSKKFVA